MLNIIYIWIIIMLQTSIKIYQIPILMHCNLMVLHFSYHILLFTYLLLLFYEDDYKLGGKFPWFIKGVYLDDDTGDIIRHILDKYYFV